MFFFIIIEPVCDREGKVSLQESAHGRGEAPTAFGKRLVSEREWLQLQDEVEYFTYRL